MTSPIKSVGFECKHVNYGVAQDGSPNDLLFIKENEHFSDGSIVPRTRMVRNYERHFYVTREPLRNYQEKQEWLDIKQGMRFPSTQLKLAENISRALGRGIPKDSRLNKVCRSPYVYGADVSTPTLAKHHYMKTWPNNISINSVAAGDSETDMETGEIIMFSVTFKTRVRLIVVKHFMRNVADPEKAIRDATELYIGDVLRSRGATLELEFVDNAGACAVRAVETAHEWKPDFWAMWNMDFDVPKLIEAMVKYGYDPNTVFPDPSVPAQFRRTLEPYLANSDRWSDIYKACGYRQGKKQKVTASGDTTPLHPAEQWHQLDVPASWYLIDPMCVYLRLRVAKGKEPSYALDAILEKHGVKQKLKFTAADGLSKGAWHVFMQKNHPAEYCVYNIYDSIALELLDESTTDLQRQISSLCGHSEYHRFPSQPRRLCDDLHFFGMERGRVIATTSDMMEIEIDKLVVGLNDWMSS